MTNAEKLAALNAFRIAEDLPVINVWKVARHQPMLDAYNKAATLAAESAMAAEVEPVAEVAAPVAKRGAPKSKMPTQNGITMPKAGGLCAQAWALFDELGANVVIKDALEAGYARGLNDNNIRTELCRWRKFHGINAKAK